MKLKITDETIRSLLKPQQFSLEDIVSVTPNISVGQFKGCALNLVQGCVIIVTNGIALKYAKLNDFLSGLEPASLVKDSSIEYDQKEFGLEIYILPEVENDVEDPDFAPIRELMFGAREYSDETLENSNDDIDDGAQQ